MSTDAVRSALQAISKKGRVTPRAVVTAAKVPSHPLHDRFEWDDAVASDKWRLEQARVLIRSVKLDISTETVDVACYYHHDPSAGAKQGYVSVPQLKTEPENARAVVALEFMRAEANMKRAALVADALGSDGAQIVYDTTEYLAAAKRTVESLPEVSA